MVAAVAKAKKVPKPIATEKAVPAKRPHREAEPEVDAPRPSKRVKKLAKKGDREIHVVPSDTTGTAAPAGSPPLPDVSTPPAVSSPAATAAPIGAPASASEPVVAPAAGKSAAPVEAPSSPAVVLEV